jgi:ATP-binding cassette subfamily B protein/ATP-binding cassette subfamily C protein
MNIKKREKTKKIFSFFHNIFDIIIIVKNSSPVTFFLILLCNIILGLIVSANLYLWKSFVDSSINVMNNGKLILPIIFLATMCCVKILTGLLNRINTYLQRMQQEYMNKYISNIIMEKVNELDMTFFDEAYTYDLIEKVNQDSISRCISMLNMMITLVQNITKLFGTVTIILVFDPMIALLCFLATIPIFMVSIAISKEQYLIFVKRMPEIRYVDSLKDLPIQYNNIKELKLFRAVPYIQNIMNTTYDKYIKEDKVIRKRYIRKQSITDIIQNITSYILRFFILFNVLKKQMTIGDLTMYIQAMENLESSIYLIMDIIATLYTDNLYIENLIELINTMPNNENNYLEFPGSFRVIEFKNVSFKYPSADKYSLKNVNLKIEDQKAYALVGENGSGKTTLIKLLMRLYDPTEGEILIDGINIKEYSKESIYKKIGVIFQDYIKYPLDVQANIGIGFVEEIENWNRMLRASEKSKADIFISQLPQKYHSFLNKEYDEGMELSIGQWQKIAISRAYMNEDAAILILDEPSAALDPKAEYEMFHDFKQLTPNKASILITHRFSNVKLADKIFVMRDGELIEEGTHDQLISINSVYRELYNMQAESYIL